MYSKTMLCSLNGFNYTINLQKCIYGKNKSFRQENVKKDKKAVVEIRNI